MAASHELIVLASTLGIECPKYALSYDEETKMHKCVVTLKYKKNNLSKECSAKTIIMAKEVASTAVLNEIRELEKKGELQKMR